MGKIRILSVQNNPCRTIVTRQRSYVNKLLFYLQQIIEISVRVLHFDEKSCLTILSLFEKRYQMSKLCLCQTVYTIEG